MYQMSLQGIRLEIGKSLRDITFKKCVAKCPGGVSGVGMAGGRRAQRSDSGEGRLLLCCREEIYPRRLSRSPRNLSPLFSHRDAHITFSRRRVRACVHGFSQECRKNTSCITWGFSVPRDDSFSCNWMQPGCTLCLFAVGERKRGRER